jgi:ceramide glucosyltransferase
MIIALEIILLTLILGSYVLEWDTGRESLKQVFARELRWGRTIRYNRGTQYYSMVFCYGSVYCILLLLISGLADWAVIA